MPLIGHPKKFMYKREMAIKGERIVTTVIKNN
jgi:hypothetical protein